MSPVADPKPFDWQRMPLQGRVLIEASAGTGKTYNIGLVYLRLLLEGEAPLTVEHVLVTTFTDAAAQELRERLRARLVQAERLLSRQDSGADADVEGSLESYLAALSTEEPRRTQALRRVQIARADFDRAPITTIHGLCLRVRRDFPLQSGAGFVAIAPSDESALLRECVEDFWRARYLGTAVSADAAVLKEGPGQLLRSIATLFARDAALIPADGAQEIERLLHQVREPSTVAQLRALAHEPGHFAPRRTRLRDRLRRIVAALADGADPTAVLEKELDDAFEPAAIDEQQGPQARLRLNDHAAIGKLKRLRQLLPLRHAFQRGRVLADALAFCRTELPRRARRRDALTFSMLIDEVHERLHTPGGDLADVLFDAFPAALIDEFQDTDRRQFAIFDRIYRTSAGAPRGALVMIGDPKQAIFGFRGGDIAAYLRAASDTPLRYSLAVNYRSSGTLIGALNALYAQANGGFEDSRIRYRPMQAAERSDALPYTRCGAPLAAPLTIHRFRGGMTDSKGAPLKSATELEALALEDCANRIVELLGDPQRTLGSRRIAPGDIAVLLTTNRQIGRLRELLTARRVPCVGSGRGSVFDTDTARDLELILFAVLNVDDDRAVCGALTTRLLGADYADVIRWQDDSGAFEHELQRFVGWRDLVATRGVLALIEALLELHGARWLAQPDGERRITDLRHLGELLAEQESARHGLDGLYAWYAALRRGDEGEGGDAPEPRQLRIESDLQRVALLTVHAAKGLEFPVVFLPLAWRTTYRDGQYAPTVLRFHDDQDNEWIDVGSADFCAHRERHFKEDLQERMRLLYVALTRAEHALHVYWVDLGPPPERADRAWEIAPFDRLLRAALHGLGVLPSEAALDALAQTGQGIGVADSFTDAMLTYAAGTQQEPLRIARDPLPQLRAPQWLHSFSGLVRNLPVSEQESPAADEGDALPSDEPDAADAAGDTQLLLLQGLRGARFGDAVHSIFEKAAPGDVWPAQRELVEQALGKQAVRNAETEATVESVARLVDRVRGTELADGLRLAQLSAAARVAEFEFQLPLRSVPVRALRALCARHGHADVVPGSLQAETLNGMLTGFIDLVFAHAGRYHVLDYKSNWLGMRLTDYSGAALDAAMRQHHYELQALLYSVALHRYLIGRLDGYTPERHLGDSWYLFLRATGLAAGAGLWRRRWPWRLIVELDDAFDGAAQEVA